MEFRRVLFRSIAAGEQVFEPRDIVAVEHGCARPFEHEDVRHRVELVADRAEELDETFTVRTARGVGPAPEGEIADRHHDRHLHVIAVEEQEPELTLRRAGDELPDALIEVGPSAELAMRVEHFGRGRAGAGGGRGGS